jgi:uncharacterized protein Usg
MVTKRVYAPEGKVSMADRDFIAQLRGYGLTTAEILYHLPDHPTLLQSYIWQDYDLAPRFPKLLGFLDFWNGNLDGKVHRVRVTNKRLIDPAEFRYACGRFVLN